MGTVTSKRPTSKQAPASRRLTRRRCTQCGDTFERIEKEIRRAEKLGKPMYCSKRCAALHRGSRPPATPRKHPELVHLECGACGVPFTLPGWDHAKKVRRGTERFYCSLTCAGRGYSARKVVKLCERCGDPTGNQQRRFCRTCLTIRKREIGRRLDERACPFCGVIFTPKSSRTTYCSRTCANWAHGDRMVGKGNSHYKDGTSYALWFRSMRPLILERDGGCAVCGITGRLVVHHINEDPTDNTPENLVALCRPHHSIHHKSRRTPWPWFATYAQAATRSTTSQWKARTTSLRERFSSTTA